MKLKDLCKDITQGDLEALLYHLPLSDSDIKDMIEMYHSIANSPDMDEKNRLLFVKQRDFFNENSYLVVYGVKENNEVVDLTLTNVENWANMEIINKSLDLFGDYNCLYTALVGLLMFGTEAERKQLKDELVKAMDEEPIPFEEVCDTFNIKIDKSKDEEIRENIEKTIKWNKKQIENILE